MMMANILPPKGSARCWCEFVRLPDQTVYGLITAPQNVTPGAYSIASNITVTVNY
jgi:hypothetical protein